MRLSSCHCDSPANCVGSAEYGHRLRRECEPEGAAAVARAPGSDGHPPSSPTTPCRTARCRPRLSARSRSRGRSATRARCGRPRPRPRRCCTRCPSAPRPARSCGSGRWLDRIARRFRRACSPPRRCRRRPRRPFGPFPIGTDCETEFVLASTSSNWPVEVLDTHIPCGAGAIPPGSPASRMVATPPAFRVDLRERVVSGVRNPDRAVPEGDRARAVPDLGRPDLSQRPRVDLRDGAVELVHDPDLPAADRDAGGAMANGDPVDGTAVFGDAKQ